VEHHTEKENNVSKRYLIQVNVGGTEDTGLNGQWETVQHPAGGDWLTRSRETALRDAAFLVNRGETRQLRIAVSQPVYSVTSDVEHGAIAEHAAQLKIVQLKTAVSEGFYGLRVSADAGETWETVQHEGVGAWRCRSYVTAEAEAKELLDGAPAEARVQLVRKNGEFDYTWTRDSFDYESDDDDDEDEYDEDDEHAEDSAHD
jgi:hypothetical protein